jgi:sporulation protein YunB
MRRMFPGYRARMTRRALLRLFLVALLLGLLALTSVVMVQMRSMLTRLATARVSNAVNRIVSEAVSDSISDGAFQYDRMISFEKDNEGKITAVKSNMPEFNRLQTTILDDVLERISEVSTRDLSIPFGTLTGVNLLAGRGPLVRVRMQSVGSSTASFRNEFTSAGINQTKHQILLDIDVSVSILLPGFSTATKVSNSLTVAETIIVGSVPQSYTYFSSDEPIEEDAEQFVLNGG